MPSKFRGARRKKEKAVGEPQRTEEPTGALTRVCGGAFERGEALTYYLYNPYKSVMKKVEYSSSKRHNGASSCCREESLFFYFQFQF